LRGSYINSLFAVTPQQITILSSAHKLHQFPGFQKFLTQTFTQKLHFFEAIEGDEISKYPT